jgi:hypothetical protein
MSKIDVSFKPHPITTCGVGESAFERDAKEVPNLFIGALLLCCHAFTHF